MVLFFLDILIYNKSMREIRRLINSINKKCDLENKSILECLKELDISLTTFFSLFHISPDLTNDLFKEELIKVLSNLTTRIQMDPNNSLESEIEIYSPELDTSITILPNTLKIIWGETLEDDKYLYYSTEFYGITKEKEIKEIHFTSDIIKEKSKIKVNGNYPLTSAHLKMSNGHESCDITIKNSLLMKDLKNIYRILYNFNYSLAANILKIYPGNEKEIKNNIDMNKFGTR